MKRCIVVVDAQNDFLTGTLANKYAIAALPTLSKVIDWGIENDCDFIFTRDTHYDNYLQTQEGQNLPLPHCLMGSWGWSLANELKIPIAAKIINKEQFGYQYWGYEELYRYDEIIICGFVSSICVVSNALGIKAAYKELPITFISDASAGLSEEDHAAAIKVMECCQVKCIKWEDYANEV